MMYETNDPEGRRPEQRAAGSEVDQPAAPASTNVDPMLLGLYSSIVLGQARLYDVLIALLSESNSALAERTVEFHREGRLMFPPIAVRNNNNDSK